MKILSKEKNRLNLIVREIDIIATSKHPNIVTYIESFNVKDELWVVMEFMDRGSLYDLVKLWNYGCVLTESQIAYCILNVLQAVQFLHSRNRIHRDIKVDNILLTTAGDVKLADFGTAVQLTFQRLRRNTVAGTPYYMAPELIQRLPYKHSVDIWSLGITIMELVNGKPPYYELEPREAVTAIVANGVRGLRSSHLSPEIKDFVNFQCLVNYPDNRASATQLLTHPFINKATTKAEFSNFLIQTYKNYKTQSNGCNIL
uniref:Protein kinase domain-containing protein n=1 Tax=Arcella intermedia TaxID=1963864 RepID=A0A6B2LD03_9EUKA